MLRKYNQPITSRIVSILNNIWKIDQNRIIILIFHPHSYLNKDKKPLIRIRIVALPKNIQKNPKNYKYKTQYQQKQNLKFNSQI